MKKRGIPSLVVCAGILCSASAANADDYGVYLDVSYASKYMAHGWNIGDDEPNLQASATANAMLPGLQFAVWTSVPFNRDTSVNDEVDLLVKYARLCWSDSPWAVSLHGYADYWYYPRSTVTNDRSGSLVAETEKSGFKYHVGATLPKRLSIGNAALVPSYNVYYWTPAESDLFDAGVAHELALACTFGVGTLMGAKGDMTLSSTLTYHDGAFGVNPGWSHATAHAAVPFSTGTFTVIPTVNYQWSFEDTVDTENEFWATLTLALKF